MINSLVNKLRSRWIAIFVGASVGLGLWVSLLPVAAQTSVAQDLTVNETLDQLRLLNPPPQLSERPLGITEVPCELGAPTGPNEIEGETYSCGIWTVPMRRDRPELGNLDLRFIVTNATGDNPEPDPLVFLAGGPGQSAATAGLGAYRGIRPTRDILRLDQRGTGQSQRLGLEECLVLAFSDQSSSEGIQALANLMDQTETERANEALSSSLTSPEVEPLINRLCAEQFIGQGLDLNGFTTAESAQDVIGLLQALGYQTFNLHGISYGSRLAMTIMAELEQGEAPLSLRSVVLDSPFPPSVYALSELPRNSHDPVIQLLSECRLDEVCGEAYPNLEDRLQQLLGQLTSSPLTVDDQIVTAEDVARVLTNLTNTRAGYMPMMIAELEQGRIQTYSALRNNEVGTADPEGAFSLDPTDPVQRFIAKALPFALQGEDLSEAIGFIGAITRIFAEDDPLPSLGAYIVGNFEGEAQAELAQAAGELTLDDIANSDLVLDIRTAQAAAIDTPPSPEEVATQELMVQKLLAIIDLAHFLNKTIACHEDILLERFEDGERTYNALMFPQLANLGFVENQANRCVDWPVATADVSAKDPVSSAVPTLILQGTYDNRTPVFMGNRAHRELENSTLVLVPQQGHEIWTNGSDCAGRIAENFVLNPRQAPDVACLEDRQPRWQLPSE